jgi:hypothetical protein
MFSSVIAVLEAGRLATEDKAQRLALLERTVDWLTEVEARRWSELDVGRGTMADVAAANRDMVEAEIRLREEKSPRKTADVGALERRLSEVERKLDQLLNDRKGK